MKIFIAISNQCRSLTGAAVGAGLLFLSSGSPAFVVAQPEGSPLYTFTTLTGHLPGDKSPDARNVLKFNHSKGLVVDAGGNIYVANTFDQTIWRITPDGTAAVFAGKSGQMGSADGVGGAARFHYPEGLAVDTAGNIYVADSGNNTIRKITGDGAVTTLAGRAGQGGSANGRGSAAQFNYPSGVAVDGLGNIFVADLRNALIRRVTPEGVVTTLAGSPGQTGSEDGVRDNARFDFPLYVAVDSADNVYVSDIYNNAIRKVTPTGLVTTLAGQPAYDTSSRDGMGKAARFNHPGGLALDAAGNIYVADVENETIRKITPMGMVTTIAGQVRQPGNLDGPGASAQFRQPMGLALGHDKNLYVMDLGNAVIRKGAPVNPMTGANVAEGR
jgi:sugar lactone lactonase YvrE